MPRKTMGLRANPAQEAPPEWAAERLWGRLALVAASLLLVVPALGWWSDVPPLGYDASSHIVVFARVARVLTTGEGWWAPDFNLGFPIGLYYQPLPHVVGGALTAVLGGGESAVTAYKVICVALLAAYPWAIARGASQMGMRPAVAATAGVVAPMVMSTLDFGLTVRSSLILGLHSQAWAAVLMPLALGQMVRALDGRRGAFARAVLGWSLLCLSHFFYGLATIALLALWIPCRPLQILPRIGRAIGLGVATATALAFWFVPLGTTLWAMGGWPFGSAKRVDGYGFDGLWSPLVSGQLLDGEHGPAILTAAAAAGAVVALVRAIWRPAHRMVLATVLLGGLFTIGRAGLGDWVDVFPVNRAVQMFRYLGIFHLGAIWLIGISVGELVARFPRVKPVRPAPSRSRQLARDLAFGVAIALVLPLFVVPAIRCGAELGTAFRTIDKVEGFDYAQYRELVGAMRRETAQRGAARILVHKRTGLRGHFHSGLLGLWDESDVGESYGAGLHDSLNFYYLEFFHPEHAGTTDELELYGFQYIAAGPGRDFSHHGAEVVFANRDYRYWALDRRVPLCRPIDLGERIQAAPREARRRAREWLNGNGPAAGVHPWLDRPPGLHLGGETEAPVVVRERADVAAPAEPAGRLLVESRSPDRAQCRVAMARPGAMLFKVGYHPFWRAWVDGEPAAITQVFPAFLAVEVAEGHHRVTIQFQRPLYSKLLLLLSPLPFALAWLAGRRSRR
jgi:hypothetical protein